MWEYKYTFEGSTEIRTFVDERSWMTSEAFCERILEDIFNGSAPCGLSTVNSKANISNIDTLNHPIVVRRNYAQKFKQQVPVVKKVVQPKTRKRRWKSPVRRPPAILNHSKSLAPHNFRKNAKGEIVKCGEGKQMENI